MKPPPDATPPTTGGAEHEWARSGLEPTEAAAAEAMGFRPDDIVALRRSTSTEIDWPALERRLLAAVTSIRARAKPVPFDNWTRQAWSMSEAVAWLNAGFNLTAAAQWRRRGFTTPDQAAPWRQQGFDAEPAGEWREGGVDHPKTARHLIRHRVQGGDLAALVRRGMAPHDARAWLLAKVPSERIDGWQDLGLSPDQVANLHQARLLGDQRVGELIERGVPLTVIARLAELTGRTWVEIRTARDIDDIVEAFADPDHVVG